MRDHGTKTCPSCEGKKKVVKYCGCTSPCFTCDEIEYEDCRTCEGYGEVAKTEEDLFDAYLNAAEERREAKNDR